MLVGKWAAQFFRFVKHYLDFGYKKAGLHIFCEVQLLN